MSGQEEMSANHDRVGDAAAYVLGALEPDEVEAFRRHLEECVVCRDEVDALGGAVQALPMAAPQVPPPRSLRARVMRAVRREPKSSSDASRRRRFAWPAPRMAFSAAVAAAVLAAAIVVGLELSSTGPAGRVIPAQVSGISGSAELRLSSDRAELIVRHLTPPPPNHVYEVWLKSPGVGAVPASVLFNVSSSGAADVSFSAPHRGVSQVMVTPEPTGGSPMPTHAPVIVASLT